MLTTIAIGSSVLIFGLFTNAIFGMRGSSSMMGGSDMMSNMMNRVPQDVTIKILSSHQVPVGKQAQVKLLILDKNTGNPLSNASIIVGIEKGAPMSTMEMTSPMFKAENIGNGKYLVRFTLDEGGYYTMHTHVIPAGKSMYSMMDNHMDIGIFAKKLIN
jgi:hypothetical protein